ncbi:MAG TPA: SDR family NAD(P)-dependent oxidoreductase [Pyrinomonadaceae bacterium]|jgi:short-subunit dehydrogenase|nr:SDR family NAD(P)-dependent oxidoreductase [Pyrinomonadaceae bacterium]
MNIDWSNKVVFITGASSGIGRSLAIELGRRGAALGLLARRADNLRELEAEVRAAGGRALALPADVRDAAAVRAAADELRAHFGKLDVMVANAGLIVTTPTTALEPGEVADVMNVNVLGAVNCVTAVVPEMLKQRSGQLVAISSLAAYRGLAKSGAYCASKAALSTFFESLRVDLRGSGVDVTIIHPGFINTASTSERKAKRPFLVELDEATQKIIRAIEARKKSYAFPWQLASICRIGLLVPNSLYDRIAAKNSFRE